MADTRKLIGYRIIGPSFGNGELVGVSDMSSNWEGYADRNNDVWSARAAQSKYWHLADEIQRWEEM